MQKQSEEINGSSLISKSLPIAKIALVTRLFSIEKANHYVLQGDAAHNGYVTVFLRGILFQVEQYFKRASHNSIFKGLKT